MKTSLPAWLFAITALTLLLSWAGLTFFLKPWLQEQAVSQTQAELINYLRLAAPMVDNELTEDWSALASQLEQACICRVSFIARDGRMLADSGLQPSDFARQEDHGHRPEIDEALKLGEGLSRRYSSSMGQGFIYVARPLLRHDALLRLGRPSPSPVSPPWGSLAAVGIASLLLAFLLAVWLGRRFSAPLRQLLAALPALAEGRCSFAWRDGQESEMGQLGKSLETTAARIKQRLDGLGQAGLHLQSLLQGMVEPMLVVNEYGRISLCNQAMQRLLNTNPLGQAPASVLRSADLLSYLREASAERRAVQGEIRLPSGQVWQAVVSPLSTEGERVEVLAILHDISKAKQLEAMRRDFVANFSHEVRTPLAGIMSAQETLAQAPDAQTLRHCVDIIARQSARLQGLVDDLLQLARLESPVWYKLPRETIALSKLLQEAGTALAGKAKAAQISIELTMSDKGITVLGEYKTLEQAVTNLLDNAIKYSPPGGVVKLGAIWQDDKALITVRDQGPGIAPEEQERIFERFYRVDKSRATGSTGLGLAIVKHAAGLHGGQVQVQSRLGQGSTFSLLLPGASIAS